jgi:hypothetical protein
MFEWIFSAPWLVLGLSIIVIFVAIGLAGLGLARRMVLPRLGNVAHDNEFAWAIHHGILIIYGLAVALIAVAVWENYAAGSKLISSELVAVVPRQVYPCSSVSEDLFKPQLMNNPG